MDIVGGLAAASQAVNIAKQLREIDKAFDAVALKGQIIDLMDKLQDVRGALQDARDELDAKDAEITRLTKAMTTKEAGVEHHGYLYRAHPDKPGTPMGYPYCSRCMEVENLMIVCTGSDRGRNPECPNCHAIYRDAYPC